MSIQADNSKRIAKNTAFLYIRMLTIMGVTFYTSRVILSALGVVDFGIYNVVGGLSSSFIFFSSALTNSTQRFLNMELGVNSLGKVRDIFNLSLLIYTVIALVVFIVGIVIGSWFIEHKLVIPADRLNAAYIILYTMLISLGITFIASVFESVLIARENMKLYAYLGVFDAMTKLGIAYCIMHINEQKLILYAIMMALAQVILKAILVLYCFIKYPECKISFYWNKWLFKEMFSFTGWNIYGSGVWMINEQGINILLNIFFGPVVNAARGISVQVNNAINNFSTNFFVAVRPQIIKTYAVENYGYLKKLVFASSKFSVYLLWILCVPVILRTEYVLSIWLGEVPNYTVSFVQWILVYSLVNSLNNPVWSVVMATGRLKKTVLIGSNIFLLAFPISYIFIKIDFSPSIVYLILVLMRLIFLFVSILIVGKLVNLTLKEYCLNVLLPIIIALVPISLILQTMNIFFSQNFISFVSICLTSTLLSVLSIYACGISQAERTFILKNVKNVVSKYNK